MISKDKNRRKLQRKARIRAKISGSAEKPRLSVYKSLKHIYAQVIDDEKRATLLSVSTLTKEIAGKVTGKNKKDRAGLVGEALAKIALEKGITTVAFDRNGNPYHGRIKALAEAARKTGLKF